MAKCDEGYLCDVCGEEVGSITDSDLYLRFVIGRVDPETLHTSPERHLRCNPSLAQYIIDDKFDQVFHEGPFAKRNLSPQHVTEQEALVTRGWRRLRELVKLDVPITEYPLPEVIARLRGDNANG
ncbi:hypothetical protein MalM25_13730 [Planctomycetes bacterium MalM25]|nr:hypothetical protein MalM25_13730 [Planctomycetes bacterium MalM25]